MQMISDKSNKKCYFNVSETETSSKNLNITFKYPRAVYSHKFYKLFICDRINIILPSMLLSTYYSHAQCCSEFLNHEKSFQ